MTGADELQRSAAEYVLGTLTAEERAAARVRLEESPEFRDLVKLWENRLAPLHELSVSARAPEQTWARILAALPGEGAPEENSEPEVLPEGTGPLAVDTAQATSTDSGPPHAPLPDNAVAEGAGAPDLDIPAPDSPTPDLSAPDLPAPDAADAPSAVPHQSVDDASAGAPPSGAVAHETAPENVLPDEAAVPEAGAETLPVPAPDAVAASGLPAGAETMPEPASSDASPSDDSSSDNAPERADASAGGSPVDAPVDAVVSPALVDAEIRETAAVRDPQDGRVLPANRFHADRMPEDADTTHPLRADSVMRPAPPDILPILPPRPRNPWPAIAALFLLMAIAFASVLISRELQRDTSEDFVAVLQQGAHPPVMLMLDAESGRVFVRRVGEVPPAGMIYRLWLVSHSGGTRLLCAFRQKGDFQSAAVAALTPEDLADATLQVTLEPVDAPQSVPMGRVVFFGQAMSQMPADGAEGVLDSWINKGIKFIKNNIL